LETLSWRTKAGAVMKNTRVTQMIKELRKKTKGVTNLVQNTREAKNPVPPTVRLRSGASTIILYWFY